MSNENERFCLCRSACILFCAIILSFTLWVQAAPVNSSKAEKAVKGWLKSNRKPLNAQLSNQVKSVDTFEDEAGNVQYHVVNLRPEGYVVVTVDDELEPIIAFSAKGTFDSSLKSPLGLLVHKDTLARNKHLKMAGKQQRTAKKTDKQKKWDRLIAEADRSYNISYGLSGVTDVRVAPLLQSEWGQTHDGTGEPCYNYYTPENYPSGCVATAMAQLMRYFQFPTSGIGLHTEQIKVDDVLQSATTRGGNGSGGPYIWSNMPMVPIGADDTERSAIGALCYDAGVAVGMQYTESASGAFLVNTDHPADADRALVDVFGFSNCIGGDDGGNNLGAPLSQMALPNLDAGLPVILGIYDSGDPLYSGHAVLADGYGYDSETLYYHLNMGWYGQANVWYALPVVDADNGYYSDVVDECLYNIFTGPVGALGLSTGEVVSGRVTDLGGLAVEGMLVTAWQEETLLARAITSANGIYALWVLPSDSTITVALNKDGEPEDVLSSVEVTTGLSLDNSPQCGNVWGINFEGVGIETPPVASDIEIEVLDPNAVTIELLASDEGLPEPLSYIVTSLPEHGWLFDPNDDSEIVTVPYTLMNDANTVTYKPCPYYFTGEDAFTFMANDGGIAPDGGDSNIADVNVVMNMLTDTIVAEDTNNRSYFPFLTGFRKVRTQVLYHADDLGGKPELFSTLALNIETAPAIEIQNWTIRMKHTELIEYPLTGAEFDNEGGWTVVYDANETIPETGWHDFELQGAFAYDGVSNLLIDFSFDSTAVTGSTGYGYVKESEDMPGYRSMAKWDDTGNPLEFVSPGFKWKRLASLRLKGQPDTEVLYADFNYNCSVGAEDMLTMIDTWLAQQGDANYNSDCDISVMLDNKINLADFVILASEWLAEVE